MYRFALMTGCFILLSGLFLRAQEAETPTKRTNHFVGVQVNELMRQLISSNSTTTINNPYYIDYSFNSVRNGWGMHTGVGYVNSNTLSGDATINTRSDQTNAGARIGIERKRYIGKKWLMAFGLDVFYTQDRNITEVSTNQIFSNSNITTKVLQENIGNSLRATLSFLISERVILGTETSYSLYYSESTRETSNAPGGVPFKENSINTKFNAPLVLWIYVKF